MPGKSRLSSSILIVLLVVSCVSLAAPAMAQDARALFEEGYKLYQQGRSDEAVAKFKEVLATNPSQEDAMWMRDQAAWSSWAKMLANQGDEQQVASRILELATLQMKAQRRDDQAIGNLVTELRGADFGARAVARRKLADAHGAFAVPALVGALGDEGDDDFRIEAMYTLTLMRGAAVLPLVEAMHTDNEFQRANIASVLGNIRDLRAVPALKAAMDQGGNSYYTQAVGDAMSKIGSNDSGSSAAMFAALASAYYHGNPDVLTEASGTKVVWNWSDGALNGAEVPSFLYHLLLAEGFSADALALDADHAGAWVLVARSWLAQWAAIEARQTGDDDGLAALAGKTSRLKGLAAGAGTGVLNQVVMTCLSEGERDVEVASKAVALLGHMEAGPTFNAGSSSLPTALRDGNKGVRYAAAIALSTIQPAWNFEGSGAVAGELARALGEPGMKIALVISADDDVRNGMLQALNGSKAGMLAIGARSGLQGLRRAKGSPPFDVVVCDSNLPDILPDRVLSELKNDYRTESLPVVMLSRASDLTEVQNLFNDRAQGVVVHDGDQQETVTAVSGAIASDGSASRGRAVALATAAAKALASLAQRVDVGAVDGDAAMGLKRALTLEDGIRVPATRALGFMGFADAASDLAGILSSTGNSPASRAAAAEALGRIAQRGGGLSPEAMTALVGGLASDDMAVSSACGRGLGMSAADGATRAKALEGKRLSPGSVFSDSSQ